MHPRLVGLSGGQRGGSGHQILIGEADDEDSFVDIMSGTIAVSDAESEC